MYECMDCGNAETFKERAHVTLRVTYREGTDDLLDEQIGDIHSYESLRCANCDSDNVETVA